MIAPHGRGHRPDRSPRSSAHGVARRHARRLHQRQRRRALLRQLAAGRRQDGPHRGRHPRALDRALAGAHRAPAATSAQLVHDDGLDRRRCSPPPASPPIRRYPLDGVSLLPVLRRSGARASTRPLLLAHEPPRPARAARGALEVPARRRPRVPVRPRRRRARARQPRARASRRALAAMRADWEAWNATMPPIPADATVSLGYGASRHAAALTRGAR